MRRTTVIAFLFVTLCLSAEKNVLYIGNSYVYTNDLPAMIEQMAASTGDKISYQTNAPGGCTFSQHCQNQSMTMIKQGGWDVVVLQEQSQYPAFPIGQVTNECFPYAKMLVDSIYHYNTCPEPMFFMTWGRKNGDSYNAQFYPPLGTYEGMDSLLRERYLQMGRDNHASVCPAGKVWHYIRHNFKEIELYSGDESHPSVEGTYAAACAFYAMIFEKDPTLVTYCSTVDTAVARSIRQVAKTVVYDSLSYWKREMPVASFAHNGNKGLEVEFSALTEGADEWEWEFGDGETYYGEIVRHTFDTAGRYDVKLVVGKHCLVDSVVMEVVVTDSVIESAVEDVAEDVDGVVRVYDVMGRMVYVGELRDVVLPEGVYFINRKKIFIKRK